MSDQFLQRALGWVMLPSGEGFLTDEEYCPTRDVFQARLDHARIVFEKAGFQKVPLLIAVMGEVGNNAYDHNIGSWRDVPGTYFTVDLKERSGVIADRGQGILATIRRAKPEVADDREALHAAFTEKLSGRQPEQRGNGLKFVKSIVERERWTFACYSGSARVVSDAGTPLGFEPSQVIVKGCVTFLSWPD